ASCPWIALVNLPINKAIEEHGSRPGRDHATQNQQHDLEAGPSICRHHQGSERERQGENGMGKANEPKKPRQGIAAILGDSKIVQHSPLVVHALSNDASRSCARVKMGFPCAKKMRTKSRSRSLRSERTICFWLVQYFLGNKVKPCESKLISASPMISVRPSSG